MVLNWKSSWKQPEEVLIHTVMSPKFLCLSKFRCSCSDRQLLRSSGKEGGAKQHDSIFPYQGIFRNFEHLTDKLCLIRKDCGEGWVNWPATGNWLNFSLFFNTEECRGLKIFCQERFPLISLPHSHDSVNERESTQREGKRSHPGATNTKKQTYRNTSITLCTATGFIVLMTACERALSYCRQF